MTELYQVVEVSSQVLLCLVVILRLEGARLAGFKKRRNRRKA